MCRRPRGRSTTWKNTVRYVSLFAAPGEHMATTATVSYLLQLIFHRRISSGVSSIRVHPQHPGVLICTQALGRPVLVVFDSTSRRRSKPNRAVLGPGAPNMTATVGSPGCLIQPPVLCVVRAWTRELTLDDIPASRRVPADAGRSPTNGAAACWLYRSRSKTRSS